MRFHCRQFVVAKTFLETVWIGHFIGGTVNKNSGCAVRVALRTVHRSTVAGPAGTPAEDWKRVRGRGGRGGRREVEWEGRRNWKENEER